MKRLFYLFGLLFFISSCVKNNPDPSWLVVNEWDLQANADLSGDEGELTHNFTEAWVYVDNNVLGVFEVPFKIPILKSGMANIKIYPAIKNNGISATKKIYPFVEVYEVNVNLVQNQEVVINPVTRYKNACTFLIYDFESAASGIENDPTSLAQIHTGNDPAILKWGNNYGEVNLTETDSTWVGYTGDQINLPIGQEIYLEIDYYNTNALVTGVLAISPTQTKNNQNIQLNAQNESTVKWKKIYIDLKEIVSNSDFSAQFRQSFQAVLDSGDTTGQIIIDNLKLIHY